MTIKFTQSMSDADVAKGITSVGKRSKSIRKDMHSLAVSILNNWAKSGDVSTAAVRATQMLSECDPAFAQKIVNWFALHASFEMVEVDGDNVFGYDENKTKLTAEEFQVARAESMFDLTQDKAPEPYDLLTKINNLIQVAEKKREKGVAGDNIPSDVIKGLKALVAPVVDH